MASRPRNVGGQQAKNYYYDKDPVHSNEDAGNGILLGGLAAEYGLEGTEIDSGTWRRLCSGQDPLGQDLNFSEAHLNERNFVDLPLNAPKSFSVAAQLDDNLRVAMKEATADFAHWLENNYAHYRETENGQTDVKLSDTGLKPANFSLLIPPLV